MDFAAILREEIEAKRREASTDVKESVPNEMPKEEEGEKRMSEVGKAERKTRKKEKSIFVFEEGDPLEVSPITRDLFEGDPRQAMKLIYSYFSRLLSYWSAHLGEDDEKACEQARLHLPILLRLIEKDQLSNDVQAHLVSIAAWMQLREYVRGADAYLRLAIGNAPWPIGVTSVTIHERSALSRIKQSEVAHVLNDEQSRKWIQSVKRLMTACQRLFPASDPAKLMG